MNRFAALALVATLTPAAASAQTLGVFKWQLQSFCNVVALTVTQTLGGVFTLDGFDDQCGASTRAPVTGLATFNPNGTVEFGFAIVATPSAAPVHVAAAISLGTLNGTWRDSAGGTGNFVFTPGNGTGGSPRPLPGASFIPAVFSLRSDGGFLATGTFGTGTIPTTGTGTRMMWHPNKAAFRVGRLDNNQPTAWDEANVGSESVAFNKNTRATATFSAAFGDSTLASGQASTAMGFFTTASGNVATAMGTTTTASGAASTTMGSNTTASGQHSVAMGSTTIASGAQSLVAGLNSVASGVASFATGDNAESGGLTTFAAGFNVIATGNRSIAMGQFVRALAAGSFIFGDGSGGPVAFAPAPNTFTVRSAGGAKFFSNAALTTGVELPSGGGAWSALSDVNMKENFRDLDGDDLLTKIARMPVREWNYKSQAAEVRHVGPTAQDFSAAFGLGESPLRISTIDADGIALAGVKALESRTRELREQNETLTRDNELLRSELAALRERLDRLEHKRQ